MSLLPSRVRVMNELVSAYKRGGDGSAHTSIVLDKTAKNHVGGKDISDDLHWNTRK
jgi:hypothetical protein